MQSPPSPFVVVLGFVTFALMGLEQSMLGSTFVPFSSRFVLDQAAVGGIVSAQFLGSLLGSVASAFLVARVHLRAMGMASSLLFVLGLLMVAFVPLWWGILLGFLVVGLGYGAAGVLFNTLFSTFGEKSSVYLNLINGMWGLGGIVGPFFAKNLLPSGLAAPFQVAAVIFAALFFGNLALGNSKLQTAPAEIPSKTPSSAPTPRVKPILAWSFLVMITLYSATEIGAGSWQIKHLTSSLGVDEATQVNSIFWLVFTLGRFMAAPLSLRVKPLQMVLGAGILMLLASILIHFLGIAPYGYAFLALACAPVFPTAIAWFTRALPALIAMTPIFMIGGSLGSAASPKLIGLGVDHFGITAIPWGLTICCVLFLLMVGYNVWRYPSRLEG
jgi:fucose permease